MRLVLSVISPAESDPVVDQRVMANDSNFEQARRDHCEQQEDRRADDIG